MDELETIAVLTVSDVLCQVTLSLIQGSREGAAEISGTENIGECRRILVPQDSTQIDSVVGSLVEEVGTG